MSDTSHKWTDKRLAAMEKRLTQIYSQAGTELEEKTKKFYEKFDEKDKAKLKELESQKEKLSAEEYQKAEAEYQRWRRTQLFTGENMEALEKEVANQMLNVNQTAIAYVNGQLPEVYAVNYNAVGEKVAASVKGYSFTLSNPQTVRVLATENKSLLPYKKLDPEKDVPWNMKRLNAEILQGTIQGESVNKIALRVQEVTKSNQASAIRTARTAVTGSQNRGRFEQYKEAASKGVILGKKWRIADNTARTSHFNIDGQIVQWDKPFSNGLMYPGDPSGSPEEVYNCRCTMDEEILGFSSIKR